MTNFFIVPGLGNSGPDHWQTHFEKSSDHFKRIQQKEWDAPTCSDWVSSIENEILQCDSSNVILIAHSLGCTTIAHWVRQYKRKIKGALLVAPSDIESPVYEFPAKGFNPIPLDKMNFKTIVVASTNDPWVSIDRAQFFADQWGSELINIGEAGHINTAAGFGEWRQGLEILKRLAL